MVKNSQIWSAPGITTDVMLKIARQVFPNHLWVNKRGELFHIDNPIQNRTIGYLSLIFETSVPTRKDKIGVLLYNAQSKNLHDFLQEVGGNEELYKELIILHTGENPWNK